MRWKRQTKHWRRILKGMNDANVLGGVFLCMAWMKFDHIERVAVLNKPTHHLP